MKFKHDKETYLRRVEMNLDNANYSDEKKKEILGKLRINNVDRDMEKYNWHFLRRYYLKDFDSINIRFYKINEICHALVVKKSDGTYTVSFSFIHPKDWEDVNFVNDFRKWTIINYAKKKYTYDGLKAKSSINAICLAYNQNYNKFPKHPQLKYNKIVPFLVLENLLTGDIENCTPAYSQQTITYDDISKGILCKPDILIKSGLKYKDCKKQVVASGVDPKDIRYYLTFRDMNVMVIRSKDGTFSVTFSFMSPKDAIVFDKFCKTPFDYVMSGKITLMRNYLDGRFTYKVEDANNSISAVVRAFNYHKKDFPSKKYKGYKMYAAFHDAFEKSENYYYALKQIKTGMLV